MPSRDEILGNLTGLANDYAGVAIGWHVLLALSLVALAAGLRPARRLVAAALGLPLISVAIFAGLGGNPFNAIVFVVLALAFGSLSGRFTVNPVQVALVPVAAPGIVLIGFGWCYPHFLRDSSWTAYLYAAPLGLIPCPTLSAVIGIALLLDLARSDRYRAAILAGAGILYGATGVFRLDVAIDWILLVGGTILAVVTIAETRSMRRVAVLR